MTSISLLIWAAVGLGVMSILFVLHELKNAPYDDGPEPEQALSEREKQRLRYLSWD